MVVTSLQSMNLIEAFGAFPEVEKVILIKADLQRQGVSFAQTARNELARRQDIAFKGYHIFSKAMAEPIMYEHKIPAIGYLEDGTEQGTCWQTRTGYPDTPYVVDYVDGEFWVLWNGKRLCRTQWAKPPRWYSMTLENGTPMAAIVQSSLPAGTAFVTLNKHCDYFSQKKQCLFCDMTTFAAAQKAGGEKMVLRKEIEDICDVLEIAFGKPGVCRLFLTGGAILGMYKGMTQVEWYAQFLEAIGRRLVQWPCTTFQIGALDEDGFKRIHATGVPDIQMNLEVWDKKLFGIICPGKNEAVGYDEWKRRMLRAVDIWGPGRVTNNFVAGVEMCQPWGFIDVDEAVKSTAEGYEWLMSNGIHSRYGNIWCVESLSKLAGNKMPPLEYFIKLAIAYNAIREKYFPHPNPVLYGQERGYAHGLDGDMAYWHGTGLNARKLEEKAGIAIRKPDYTKYL